MAYSDVWTAANDAGFQGRCTVACWKAAQDILAESVGTPNHLDRVNWANKVLGGTVKTTGIHLAAQVMRNSTIAAAGLTALDTDIQFQINSIVGDLLVLG